MAKKLTLMFDADDTLWENNIYFERAIAAFISYLDHRVHSTAEVREHLNACERATIAKNGYGLISFRQSLAHCFEQLSDSPLTAEKHERLAAFAASIALQPMELLPGVAETLQTLSGRHRLLLVTKGDFAEQTEKLMRSGLQPYFAGVEVLHEKDEAAYRELAARHRCAPSATWMIGNSPKSDVNPALAAGLNAVFLPHGATWVLEHESIEQPDEPGRLLELSTISDLLRFF